MNARHAPLSVSNLVLRVLGGRQKGADYRLASGLKVTIGHSFNHDVVLRSPDTKDLSLELHLTDMVAQLRVVAGTVQLLGRPLGAGEQAQLPAFVPVTIGETSFAIGDAQSERWTEAMAISEAPVAVAEVFAEPSVPSEAPTRVKTMDNAIQHFSSRFEPVKSAVAFDQRWPLYAGLAALLLLVAAISGPIGQFIEMSNNGPAAIDEKLARAGFKGVKAIDKGSDKIIVAGLLRSDADLARLRNFAAEKLDGVEINVRTMEELAEAATGVLAGQDVDAVAKPARGNAVLINSEYLPKDRQDELIAMIKKDIPQLGNVIFKIEPGRGDRDLQYFFSSGDFGLASFVDGDPAYIKTADGTRWFKGAVMPTGHNITAMGNGRIQFERNGQIEELNIIPDGDAGSAPIETNGSEISSKSNETSNLTKERT